MGALRKTAPEILQPTQIIIFPVDQARPDLIERPSAWERFADSPVGSLILFELKMFATVAAVALVLVGSLAFGYTAKSAAGIDIYPEASLSQWKPAMDVTYMQPAHTYTGQNYN